MKQRLEEWKRKPGVAHLLRAYERFDTRLGSQFAAAVTYFSVLALVPILLLSFAILGFVLTVLRPELIGEASAAITEALGSTDAQTQQKIGGLALDYLRNWRGVGLVALLAALYSGAGWMGNLKNAVRAQWRPDFDLQEPQGNIVVKTLVNLVTLLGLTALVAVTFALASLSTALSDTVLEWLGLTQVGWLRPVLQYVPIVFSIGAGWLLFMYLYSVLPEQREPSRVLRRGALIGAIGLAVLQYGTGLLFAAFQGNKAAQLFGPVIVLMLFFNLFAQLILFVAAWIATGNEPAEPAREVVAPTSDADSVRRPAAPAYPDLPPMVPGHVAARTVRVGLGAGYVTGAATGVGLGAVAAWLLSKTVRRPRPRTR